MFGCREGELRCCSERSIGLLPRPRLSARLAVDAVQLGFSLARLECVNELITGRRGETAGAPRQEEAAMRTSIKSLVSMALSVALAVSARTGAGVEALPRVVGERLRALERVIELQVPYDRGDVLAGLHRDGEVLVEVHEEGGTRVRARLPQTVTGRYVDFVAPLPG